MVASMKPGCAKLAAFAEFDRGKRPAHLVGKKLGARRRVLPATTLYKYFQDWKKRESQKAVRAEIAKLREDMKLCREALATLNSPYGSEAWAIFEKADGSPMTIRGSKAAWSQLLRETSRKIAKLEKELRGS